ncbi:MAG: hypothetical protein O2887_16955 [Bacteroidetes bacterium]|nr:hypothetical protein [Bacteroidota bacterium]MDA1122150.1 hypothetical protein [Bacteroidota bacterium]
MGKLFNPTLIKPVESNPNYHIESSGVSILVYPFNKNKDPKSVNELIEFGKALAMTTLSEVDMEHSQG